MVHSEASFPTAEDDVLQLSVIRAEAGDAGGERTEGNNKMEDTVSKRLVTLSNVDQVICKNRHKQAAETGPS